MRKKILDPCLPTMPAALPRHRSIFAFATLIALAGGAMVYTSDGHQEYVSCGKKHRPQSGSTGPETGAEAGTTPFPGMYSLGTTRLMPGAVIDAWNSPIEDFLQGRTQNSGRALVRSAGPIELQFKAGSSPTVIVGHANPAPGSDVRIDKGGFVTGSIAASDRFEFLPSLPEAPGECAGELLMDSGQAATDEKAMAFHQVRISGDASWTLRGPLDLRIGDLQVLDRATLVLDTSGGPIALHVTGSFNMESGTTLSGDPGNMGQVVIAVGQGRPDLRESLQRVRDAEQNRVQAMRNRLLGKDSEAEMELEAETVLSWKGQGQFFGLLYAPYSKLHLSKELRFQGSMTGASIEFAEGSHATCDERALAAWALMPGDR